MDRCPNKETRDMRNFRRPLALLMASGLWAGAAGAVNLNLGNTATRPILILSEDSNCENPGTPDPGFPGTYPNGTARGPVLSPDFKAPNPPGVTCPRFAADALADFTDTTTDFYGTLENLGGTSWRVTVPERVWGAAVATILANTPGTSFRQTTPLVVLFNSATGAVSPGAAPNFYIATTGYAGPPALNLALEGQTQTPDYPYWGTPYQLGNTSPLTLSCAGALALDSPSGSSVASPYPPFPVGETGVSFGPGYPWAVPSLCSSLIPQPGFKVSGTGVATLTAFLKSLVLLSPTLSATGPAWAPLDWKLEEATDTDADGVPDAFDDPNDFDKDGVANASDNCPYTQNVNQADSGKLGGAGADGIGDACQCGDIDNNGQVTSADVTQLKRAILGLSPLNSIGGIIYGQPVPGVPILNKCNVAATTAGTALSECTSADATVIQRALLGLAPGIVQGCKAAKPTIP